MALSEAKKAANQRWDAKNMHIFSVKMRKEKAEEFKRLCAEAGTTPHAVFTAAADAMIAGNGDTIAHTTQQGRSKA